MTIEYKNCMVAEYIWLDGSEPMKLVRSKTRVIEDKPITSVDQFPEWGFDGSSTNQATGDNSDCILKPVRFVHDPIRGQGNYLVLCEVYDRSGKPHKTNTRAVLRNILDQGADQQDAWFGFEQEYTLLNESGHPYGWPEGGYPGPQGPYYCGVGGTRVAGRDLSEDHLEACLEAGLLIYGTNAEVMLGQWEFQIGYRGFDEPSDPLLVTDHMWLATWLMDRLSEAYGLRVSYDNKPMKGDWNGAGCHTNFSTKLMRDAASGKAEIARVIQAFEAKHDEHIQVYGANLGQRLTGLHETCDINTFKVGDSDRGASIRVPMATSEKGYGYLEDRRPGANVDPYIVAARLLATICGYSFPNL
jgi:glutamine synthetase